MNEAPERDPEPPPSEQDPSNPSSEELDIEGPNESAPGHEPSGTDEADAREPGDE